MFCVYSVNRAAREAALFAIKAIAREIGREMTIIVKEVIIIVIESKSNRITFKDLLKPFKSSSKDAKIKRLKLYNNCKVFFAKRELYSTKSLIIQEVDFIVLVIFKGPYIYSNTILFLTALLRVFILIAIGLKVRKKRVLKLLAES
jgi:hypothetical protein